MDKLTDEVTELIMRGKQIVSMKNAVKRTQALVEWTPKVKQLQRKLYNHIQDLEHCKTHAIRSVVQ